MVDENLICKISFFDEELKKMLNIIGVVSKNQIFSSLYNFIELKNYGNKTILKKNLEEVIVYESQQEVFMTRRPIEINNRTKIEG